MLPIPFPELGTTSPYHFPLYIVISILDLINIYFLFLAKGHLALMLFFPLSSRGFFNAKSRCSIASLTTRTHSYLYMWMTVLGFGLCYHYLKLDSTSPSL